MLEPFPVRMRNWAPKCHWDPSRLKLAEPLLAIRGHGPQGTADIHQNSKEFHCRGHDCVSRLICERAMQGNISPRNSKRSVWKGWSFRAGLKTNLSRDRICASMQPNFGRYRYPPVSRVGHSVLRKIKSPAGYLNVINTRLNYSFHFKY